jgi:hypothetical protein
VKLPNWDAENVLTRPAAHVLACFRNLPKKGLILSCRLLLRLRAAQKNEVVPYRNLRVAVKVTSRFYLEQITFRSRLTAGLILFVGVLPNPKIRPCRGFLLR